MELYDPQSLTQKIPTVQLTCPRKLVQRLCESSGADGPEEDSSIRGSRFTDEQIVGILTEHEAGGRDRRRCVATRAVSTSAHPSFSPVPCIGPL